MPTFQVYRKPFYRADRQGSARVSRARDRSRLADCLRRTPTISDWPPQPLDESGLTICVPLVDPNPENPRKEPDIAVKPFFGRSPRT